MSDREKHARNLVDHFAGLTSYWKDIYASPVEPQDFFHFEAIKKRKKAVLDFVDAYAGGNSLRILDCGCGTGMIIKDLIQRGHRCCGVDLSPEMVEKTSETLRAFRADWAEVRIGSVEALDFKDNTFDVCLCIGVLQYLKDDERSLRELSRVTKPRGRVIISLPNITRITTLLDPYYYFYRGPFFILHRIFRLRRKSAGSVSEDIIKNLTFRDRRYHYTQLRGFGRRYGLEMRSVSPIGYGPLTLWRREYLSRSFTLHIARRIERATSMRMLSFLKAFADRWVIVFEKT